MNGRTIATVSRDEGAQPWPLTRPSSARSSTPARRASALRPAPPPAWRPVGVAATQHTLGGRRRRGRLPLRPLARQRHRQRLHPDLGRLGAERRRHRARARVRCRRAGWPASAGSTTRWPRSSATSSPRTSREELGALLPHDRRPQGGRLAVRGRRPDVPLHRRPAGHAHPHRAAQPDQPRLRARHLHRHRERARHDHDDDGLVGRRRAARELARPAHDRFPADGLPPRRGVLVLDLHGAAIWSSSSALFFGGFPTGWTGYAPLQTQAGGRHGFVPGRLRGDRHRHDPRRVQPRRHHHQLPRAGYDLGPAAHLRLGHPGHHGPAHLGHADAWSWPASSESSIAPRRRRSS